MCEELVKLKTRTQILFSQSQQLYNDMIAFGVAKECARDVLPLATPTRLYMHGSVRSWLHYIDLRQGNGTQREHRAIAEACRKVLESVCPDVVRCMWPDDDVSE